VIFLSIWSRERGIMRGVLRVGSCALASFWPTGEAIVCSSIFALPLARSVLLRPCDATGAFL